MQTLQIKIFKNELIGKLRDVFPLKIKWILLWMQSHVVRKPLTRIMALVNAMDDCQAMNMSQPQLLGYITDSAHELDGVFREIVAKARAIKESEPNVDILGIIL